MIDTDKYYEGTIKLLSENGDVVCKVVRKFVRFVAYEVGFEIEIGLCDLLNFLRTLKKVKRFFEQTENDKTNGRVSVYNPNGGANYSCKYIAGSSCIVVDTKIPVMHKLANYNPRCPWINYETCDELIDFIETNFELPSEVKDNCKEMLSVIKRIKEIKKQQHKLL